MKKSIIIFVASLSLFSCPSSNDTMAQKKDSIVQNFTEGKQVYNDFCIPCHLANGEGVANTFPPLAKSDYLMNKRKASISALKYGLNDEIVVNGISYRGNMASQGLTDQEIANVMNYITNSWGNKNTTLITEEEVSKVER